MAGAAIAARLPAALGRDSPPVALVCADGAPAGLARLAGEAPSACSFWRKAEGGVFFAGAALARVQQANAMRRACCAQKKAAFAG